MYPDAEKLKEIGRDLQSEEIKRNQKEYVEKFFKNLPKRRKKKC